MKYEIKETNLYVIDSDRGIIRVDKKGEFWLGGGREIVKPALFTTKKDAINAKLKLKNSLKKFCSFELNWIEIRPLRLVKRKEENLNLKWVCNNGIRRKN